MELKRFLGMLVLAGTAKATAAKLHHKDGLESSAASIFTTVTVDWLYPTEVVSQHKSSPSSTSSTASLVVTTLSQ